MPSDPRPNAAEFFAGGGEMGALMRAMDWSTTRFGPVDAWPLSLRTMVGVVLGSRFPMLFWWGPDLLHLYNDAYRPMLTDKHPASLGAPGAEVWAEIWDVVGPMARGVQEGGPATWSEDLELFISTGGLAEARYFTFSYSPVPGDDGRVGGVLGAVQETTAKVLSERQLRMSHELAARAATAKSEAEALGISAEVLSDNLKDIPFFLIYVLNERRDEAELVADGGWGAYAGRAKPRRVPMNGTARSAWPLVTVARTGGDVFVEGLSERFGALPPARWGGSPNRAMVSPLGRPGHEGVRAFLVVGVSPHRPFDERYHRLLRATADQVAAVMSNARAWEAELKRVEVLAEIDRAKTAFFSNVSHEFRTPLTLILGPVEQALAQPGRAIHGEELRAVHRNAVRLLRLVNSLLDFARIEAGRLDMTFVPTDLSALTAGLAASFRSLVEQAGVALVVDCPPTAEVTYVDRAQWEKIILNLLSNAFKFTFAGEISVRVVDHGSHVEVAVADTGTGIPAQDIPHIFERFHRVEGAAGRSFEGTGIGLSLVSDLVKRHGGTVDVASVLGEGSVFKIAVPTGYAHLPPERVKHAAQAAPAPNAAPYLLEASRWMATEASDEPLSVAGLQDVPPPPVGPDEGPRPRILVADDNADMRAYLKRLLEPRYEVVLVSDGRQALAEALSNRPSLVLSDAMMPRMDGIALIAALRAEPSTRQIPIVLVSARAGEEAKLAGITTGADDYVVKPFSAPELLARVRTHLALAETRNRAGQVAEELARSRAALVEQLRAKNDELEAFSYTVSHDLRAPIRAIDGFSLAILEDYGPTLPLAAAGYLRRVRVATARMGQLIDDLLALSRIDRANLSTREVDLSGVAGEVIAELQRHEPHRVVHVTIGPQLWARADPHLIRIVLENLLGNAWKFSARAPDARIAFGFDPEDEHPCFFVTDNGAGFDATYADKLFRPFQRLHTLAEFPGTGVGLATVARVVSRHGGRVWATGAVGHGATLRFTLP